MDPTLYLLISTSVMALLLVLELRCEQFRDSTFGDRRRVARNWSYLVAALVAISAVRGISGVWDAVLPRALVWSTPVWVEVVACALFGEFLNWVAHYAKHHHGTLWRFHFQHHLETRYNVWLVSHTHPLEVLLVGSLMGALMTLVGFSPLATQSYLLFYSLANTYQHSSHDYSLGPLDWLIVSPAYHRRHHAVGLNCNFGSTLTFWDVVFGTASYPASSKADPNLVYGIHDNGEPFGFEEELVWFLQPEGATRSCETPGPEITSEPAAQPVTHRGLLNSGLLESAERLAATSGRIQI